MKTYTLTESELQELLSQQREICADTSLNYYTKDRFGDQCLDYGYVRNLIRNRPSPLLPTEEVGIKDRGIIISQAPFQPSASLASHSCTIGNSIEQITGRNLRKLHAVSEDKDLWLESEANDILIQNDDTLYEIRETSKTYTSFKQINKS